MTADHGSGGEGLQLLLLVGHYESEFLRGLSLLAPWVSSWVCHDVWASNRVAEISAALSGLPGVYADRPWAGDEMTRTELMRSAAGGLERTSLLLDSRAVVVKVDDDFSSDLQATGVVEYPAGPSERSVPWPPFSYKGDAALSGAGRAVDADGAPGRRSHRLQTRWAADEIRHAYADAESYLRRARSQESFEGRLATLATGLDQLIEDRDRSSLHLARGVIHREAGRIAEGVVDLVLARDHVTDPRTVFELARTYNQIGAHRSAREVLQTLVDELTNETKWQTWRSFLPAVHIELGLSEFYAGDREEARRHFERGRDDEAATAQERAVAVSNIALCD